MTGKKMLWTIKLDWLNVLSLLGLESINEIPESKKDKALKRIDKEYDLEVLLDINPHDLDKLVATELKELMKKELETKVREEEKVKNQLKNKFIPFKNGGIIKINPQDLKDLGIDIDNINGDPEEFIRKFMKKFTGEDDDDNDEDKHDYPEDNTGYYI